MATLMSIPGYRRLVGTMAFNQTGYAMASVIVPLLIFDISKNATLAGSVSAFGTGSLILLSLFAGALTDKFHPSVVLKLVTLAQTIIWISIALMLSFSDLPLLPIVLCIVLASALSAFDAPSEQSLIKQMVPTSDLGTANAIAHGRESTAEVFGGPSAGLLYGLNPHLALFVQGAFHAIACALVPRKPNSASTNQLPEEHDTNVSVLKSSTDGFRFVFSHTGLRAITLVAAVANIPMSAFILVLIFSYRATGESAFIIGLISASFGSGVIVGSFLASKLAEVVPLGKLGTIALLTFTISLIVLTTLHSNTVATIIALFIAGLPLASFNTAIGAFTAAITPDYRMGAVTTASTIPGIFLMPFGAFLAGFGFEHWGAPTTLGLISTIALIATMMTLTSAVRGIPLLSQLDEVQS